MLVTALSAAIGDQNAAHIAEKAIAEGTPLEEPALASGKVDEAMFDALWHARVPGEVRRYVHDPPG